MTACARCSLPLCEHTDADWRGTLSHATAPDAAGRHLVTGRAVPAPRSGPAGDTLIHDRVPA